MAESTGMRIVREHMNRAGVIGIWEILADRIDVELRGWWQKTEVAIADVTTINARITAERDLYLAALEEVEIHCPCGARPESLNTHPHVIGCPVGKVLRRGVPEAGRG